MCLLLQSFQSFSASHDANKSDVNTAAVCSVAGTTANSTNNSNNPEHATTSSTRSDNDWTIHHVEGDSIKYESDDKLAEEINNIRGGVSRESGADHSRNKCSKV